MRTPLDPETAERLVRAGVRVPRELLAEEEDPLDRLDPYYSSVEFRAAALAAGKRGAHIRLTGHVIR